jgi:large subunit ribosomal protein L21
MNFAVIKTGGKQYKVAANDLLKVEKLEAQPGDVVVFDQVLMVGNGEDVTVGAPLVSGASVAAHFVETRKSRTVIIRKKERRQHHDTRNGHRQRLSMVRIGEILLGGAKTTLTADEKLKARAASAAPASETVAEAPARARKAAIARPASEMTAPEMTPAPETKAAEAKPARKAPAKKAAPAEKPAAEAKPAAKKAPAKKAAPADDNTEKPAAKKAAAKKPAAKKAAPKADKE